MLLMTRKNDFKTNGHLPSLLDDGFFADFFGPALRASWSSPVLRGQGPAVDIREYKDKFVLKADIPGVEEKDLKIEVKDGSLVIEGRALTEESGEEEEGTLLLLSERRPASFRRSFALGDAVDPERIEATYRNGTVTITLPKHERSMPRTIPISLKK